MGGPFRVRVASAWLFDKCEYFVLQAIFASIYIYMVICYVYIYTQVRRERERQTESFPQTPFKQWMRSLTARDESFLRPRMSAKKTKHPNQRDASVAIQPETFWEPYVCINCHLEEQNHESSLSKGISPTAIIVGHECNPPESLKPEEELPQKPWEVDSKP